MSCKLGDVSERRSGEARDDQADRGMPGWVKVFAGIALAIALLFAILLLIGGGHGPGRHAASDRVATCENRA